MSAAKQCHVTVDGKPACSQPMAMREIIDGNGITCGHKSKALARAAARKINALLKDANQPITMNSRCRLRVQVVEGPCPVRDADMIESEAAPEYADDTRRALMTMKLDLIDDDAILAYAKGIIDKRFASRELDTLACPAQTVDYLRTRFATYEHEVFCILMLDNRNRTIALREMFRGTIDGASVYPREVVKQALADNAAAVILAHNHPSGVAEPSRADIAITEKLKQALALVDIRVLDHVIVGDEVTCLSERGLV